MKLKAVLIVCGLCLLGVGAFLPIRHVVVAPEWKVQFVDESGKPLSGLHVNQKWKDYTYEFWRPGMHSEILISDQNGDVIFPERVVSISILIDILARINDFITLVPHVDSGPVSMIQCDGVNFFCTDAFSRTDPGPLTVTVLQRSSNAGS